jgi:hypothetical protein
LGVIAVNEASFRNQTFLRNRTGLGTQPLILNWQEDIALSVKISPTIYVRYLAFCYDFFSIYRISMGTSTFD